MPQIDIFETPEMLAAAAGELFFELAHLAIEERGHFDALLSGGTTPRAVYAWLAEHGDMLDWHKVRLFYGDERCVPPDSLDSNYRMTREAMLDTLDNFGVTTYRIEAELPPDEAAARYESTLRDLFGEVPVFDLVYLGLGTDAHTASLFPHTSALHEETAWFAANYADSQKAWRITATPPVLNNARTVAFLVSGAAKADAVFNVMYGPRSFEEYPAQLIQPYRDDVRWLLDQGAASRIEAV